MLILIILFPKENRKRKTIILDKRPEIYLTLVLGQLKKY